MTKKYKQALEMAYSYFWDVVYDDECLESAGGDICLIFFLAASKFKVSESDLAGRIMQESGDL